MSFNMATKTRIEDLLTGGGANLEAFVHHRLHRGRRPSQTAYKEVIKIANKEMAKKLRDEQSAAVAPEMDLSEVFDQDDIELAQAHAQLNAYRRKQLDATESRVRDLERRKQAHLAYFSAKEEQIDALMADAENIGHLAKFATLRSEVLERERLQAAEQLRSMRSREVHRRHGVSQILGIVEMSDERDVYLMEIS